MGKSNRRKPRDPLPERFGSIEEASEFWDTHDSGDYEEYFTDVECEVDIQRRVHEIAVESSLFERISHVAHERGVSAEALINLWLQEKVS